MPADRMPRPPFFAIGLLSGCLLAYEIALTRLFSMVLWHHFAYMIISAAMLGYGASGTALTLLRERIAPHFSTAFLATAAMLALTMPLSFLLAQQIPFNPLELLWDTSQLPKLLAIYLLVVLPFFFGGAGIGLVLWRFGMQAGRVYAADIFGAGAGSLGVVALLFFMSPSDLLMVLAALALLAAAIAAIELKAQPGWLAKFFLVLALPAIAAAHAGWLKIHPSPYKDLSQTLNISGTRVIEERPGPLGDVSVVESTRIPFRYAPGMSLNALDEPPPQLEMFVDGNGPTVLTRFDGNLAPLAHLGQLTSALPYHVLGSPAIGTHRAHGPYVLVLGAGAGADVLQALYYRAGSVDAVELDRNIIDLVRNRFGDFSGNLYKRPDVRVHEGEARGFASARLGHYDLIQVALLDSFGVASAGLYGLSESYLYTVEALQTYLGHLAPDGVLSITRWLTLPPRDSLKLFATAIAALEKSGVPDPGRRLAMIRGWKTVTLLVKNSEFSPDEIAAIREFSRTRSFDPGYYPGMLPEEANRYNLLAQPYFYESAIALLGPGSQDFIDRYKFNIEPATDDRPYFFRFFKWDAAVELFSLRQQGGMALLDWSYPLLVATLIQAVLASILLILVPLAASQSRQALPPASAALYFLAIGFAFMFMEIAFIQKFILFLSHPLYALAVVLCAFLVFAALGSWLAGRKQGRAAEARSVTTAIIALGAVALLYLAFLPGLFSALIHLPDPAKILISAALIAPPGICMGIPFPTGMARLACTLPDAIPWAWAINGFASVVGAVLASLLAVHLGFTAVILLAVALYGLACVAIRRGFA
ncbi:MAG TPA: SAM-dependent methyltransferase [Nitrosospira sp.]|nr:SAM-dependent methyltransferase [Nitrosospira sp.]